MTIGIFTGGKITDGVAVQNALKEIALTIAADSGAKNALDFNSIPQFTVGDFDSLDKKTHTILEDNQCELITYPTEKNETDTQLAIEFAITKKATKIILFGAVQGDRIDHILANIFLPLNTTIPVIFVDGQTTIRLEKGPKIISLSGQPGDLLSLIPLTQQVTNVVTENLFYPLKNETLFLGKTRGVSNVFNKKTVAVSFGKGTLLIIHTNIQLI